MPLGSWLRAALIADCTSVAASLMLRDRSNCKVMREEPSEEEEVISFTPAIRPSWRSSGVATVDAIVSGSAPGSCAVTEITGKSTCGSGETGNWVNATAPASVRPTASSVVATGRATKGAERFKQEPPSLAGKNDRKRDKSPGS